MAKETLKNGAGSTQKQKKQEKKKRSKDKKEDEPSSAFSESELDAARQLVQLSGNSNESAAASSSSSAAAAVAKMSEDGTEASSTLRKLFPLVKDFDEITRRRKYRSLRKIYELTIPPPSAGLSHAKKMMCR